MAIINDTKCLIWKHVKYSIEFSFTFAKKHPFVSSTLSFFILFYALSPSITWFFIYSLPLMFFFTILLIVFFSIPNFKHFERDVDSKPSRKISHVDHDHDNVNIDNKQKAFLRARSVRRRKSKKHIETGAEELIQGAPFRIPFNDHDFVDKGALIEEKLKDIREVEVHSISDRAECSSTSSIFKNSGPECFDYSYQTNGKCFKSFSSMYERKTEYFGEIENEGARNKAVQWKEEDQKNLMDLGLSEIERTKRLESLMARRRARKMLSLQVRRSLMNIGCKETLPPISSILIPKNKSSSSASQFSPTPGSAPSILGPNRNPFDLPYDQHEEKPNVRGGSFLQEFMLAQEQKDRNESLPIGADFLGDSNVDQREPTSCSDVLSRQMFPEASENSKSGHRLGREESDRVVEEVTTQASELEMNVAYKGEHIREGLDISQDEKDNSEVQIKSVLVEDISNRTSSTSSSEEDGPFYKIDKDAILKSIASPALRNLPSDPSHPSSSLLDSMREDERFYYPNRPVHRTSCQSIASDLQVEVSEVGSPPLTNDGSSSLDEEISIDGKIEKAIASSSEDMLMSSSHLARVDENESNSKEVREVTEQDIVDFGFSRFQMSENNVPLNIPLEQLVEPDPIASSSFPPPRTERTQASTYQQHRPEGLSVVSDSFQGSLLQPEFSVQQLPFGSTSLISPTSVLQPNCLIEQGSSSNLDHVQNDRSMNVSSERSDSIASQESELSLNNSILQVSELPSETETSNSAIRNDSAEFIIGSDSERRSENVAFSTIGQGHHSIEASTTSSSTSVWQPKFATAQLPDEVTAESSDLNTSRSSKLSLKDPKVQSSAPYSQTQKSAEDSKSLTSNDINETLCNKSGGQHIEEVNFSTISQSFDESQASSSPQDFVVEQVPTASTSSPSPNFLIQPKFSVNERSSNSEEQKRVQNSSNSEDHIPGFLSERAVNQDSISLQSTVREVPTASSSSSSPKSVLEAKSSTGQGPMLNSNREEQIGESPSPRMSRNTRTLLIDSAADKLHHAEATMKPHNDEEKSHEDATNHNDVKKEDLPKILEVSESLKNSTTKHSKSSDVENSASTSTNKNKNLVTTTETGEDRGAKEPEKIHGPIIATQENSGKGNTTAGKENIKSQS